MANASFTRRSIMSAMAIAPIAISAPAVAANASTRAWDVAFAEWKRAHDLAFNEHFDVTQDDARCLAESEAWARLMRTPAPHMKALHWKIDYLWGDNDGDEYSATWCADIVRHVVADSKRLSGQVS